MTAHQRRAAMWLIVAVSSFATLDTVAKHLTKSIPVVTGVWFRYVIPTILLGAWILQRRGPAAFRTGHPWLQFSRGAILVLSTLCFWTALKHLPIVEAATVAFIGPTLLVVLSALLLGEKPEPIHWVALVLGFVGVLIVLRPGYSYPSVGALAALGSALCYVIYQLLTRKVAHKTDSLIMLFHANAWGALLASFIVPSAFQMPRGMEWVFLFALGLIGAFGHWCMIRAYELADAPTLAPFQYSQLVVATIWGWIVFGTLPDGYTLLGMCVIIGSGLIVLLDMRRQGKPEPRPAVEPE